MEINIVTSICELSGLLTIKSFLEQLVPAGKTGDSLVIVVMDLDRLLSRADQPGHAGGDEWISDCLDSACAVEPERVSRRLTTSHHPARLG